MKKIVFIVFALLIPLIAYSQSQTAGGEIEPHETRIDDLDITTIDYQTRLKKIEDLLFPPRPNGTLLLHYKFEEDSLDETGYSRDFTPYNVTYDDMESEEGNFVLSLSSNSSYITTPSYDFTSSWSFVFNTLLYDSRDYNRTIFSNMVANDGLEVRIDDYANTISILTGNGSSVDSIVASTVINADTIWPANHGYNWVITSDGDIYKNGYALSTSGSMVSGFNTSAPIYIGRNVGGTAHFYGYTDEFKSYTGAMSSTEATTQYTSSTWYSPNTNTFPALSTAVVSNSKKFIADLYFSKDMYNYNDSLDASLTFVSNDSTWGIDSTELESNHVSVYLDNDLVKDAELKISYDADYFSGLEDFEENKLPSISSFNVTNNIEDSTVYDSITLATAIYLFENNVKDSANTWHMLGTDKMLGLTWPTPPQGTYVAGQSGGRDYTIPSLIIADTFSVSIWVYPTVEANGQEIFIVGDLKVELDNLPENVGRLQCHVNSLEAYSSSSAVTLNAWNHIVFTYNTTSGIFTVYVNGVDLAETPTARTGADLSGECAFVEVATGYLDAAHIYNKKTINATEAKFLFDNPNNSLKTPGNPSPTPPGPTPTPDPPEYETYAEALMVATFDDHPEGIYKYGTPDKDGGDSEPYYRKYLFDPWVTIFFEDSYAGRYGYGDPYQPTLLSYTTQDSLDASGNPVSRMDKGLKVTQAANQGSSPEEFDDITYSEDYMLPVSDWCMFGDLVTPDLDNTDVFFSVNVTYVPSAGFRSTSGVHYDAYGNKMQGDVWKAMCSLEAGCGMPILTYNAAPVDERPIGRSKSGMNQLFFYAYAPVYGEGAYTYAKSKVIVKPLWPYNGILKYKQYVTGGFSNNYDADDFAYQDGTNTTIPIDVTSTTDSVTVNVTVRMNLGKPNTYEGFFEFFLNGQYAGIFDSWDGLPIIVRKDANMVVDGFQFNYHWGGDGTVFPIGSNASMIVGDMIIFKYNEDYQDHVKNEKTIDGARWGTNRVLLLPNYKNTGEFTGYRKRNWDK